MPATSSVVVSWAGPASLPWLLLACFGAFKNCSGREESFVGTRSPNCYFSGCLAQTLWRFFLFSIERLKYRGLFWPRAMLWWGLWDVYGRVSWSLKKSEYNLLAVACRWGRKEDGSHLYERELLTAPWGFLGRTWPSNCNLNSLPPN